MSDPTPEAIPSKKTHEAKDKAAQAKAQKDVHTREQLLVLTRASFCSKPHPDRPQRPASFSPALEERRRESATVYEGNGACAECQQKLAPMAAALLLAVLPPTPTERLVHAARALRTEQPMTWSAIRRQNPVLLAQVVKRGGGAAFSSSEYQTLANEMLATLRQTS